MNFHFKIDLGPNLPPEDIIIQPGQENEAEDLAYEFCQKHGLNSKIQAALAHQIQQNIDQVLLQIGSSEDPLSGEADSDQFEEEVKNETELTRRIENGEQAYLPEQDPSFLHPVVDNQYNVESLHTDQEEYVRQGAPIQNGAVEGVQPIIYQESDAAVHQIEYRQDSMGAIPQEYIPISDIVSYEDEANNLNLPHAPEQLGFDHNLQEAMIERVGRHIGELPTEKVNLALQDPECRQKPKINEISKILAQNKRSHEPIHERLFKQEIMSKKIAQEMENSQAERARSKDRLKSRMDYQDTCLTLEDNAKKMDHRLKKSVWRTSTRSEEKKSLGRKKSASRLAQYRHDQDLEKLQNPGDRLYQRGLKLNQEKAKFIEQARKQKEDDEIEAHCTFKPKLVTQSYFTHELPKDDMNEFQEQDSYRAHNLPPMQMHRLQQSTESNERRHQSSTEAKPHERLMRYGSQIFQKREQLKKKLEEELTSQFNFHPQINKRSRSIANSKKTTSKGPLRGESPEGFFNSQIIFQQDVTFLNNPALMLGNQTAMPGGDNDDDLIDDDFPEELSMEDKSLKKGVKKANEEKFIALYDDAKHRTLRKEHIYKKCIDKECTFKPKLITQESKVSKQTIKQVQQRAINRSREMKTVEKPAVGGVPPKEFVPNSRQTYLSNREQTSIKKKQQPPRPQVSAEGEVFERLAKQAEIYQSIQKFKKQANESQHFDPSTGRELFKPIINQTFQLKNRPVAQSCNQVSLSLYERHKTLNEKKKKAVTDHMTELNEQRHKTINRFSEQIVAQSRKTKIGLIFVALDSDNDGLISTEKMCLDTLTEGLKAVFEPLFKELEQLNEPLDREEFEDATLRLFNTLTQNEKNEILQFGKKKKKSSDAYENCTFQPKTNKAINNVYLSKSLHKSKRPKSAQLGNMTVTKDPAPSGDASSLVDKLIGSKPVLLNEDLADISEAKPLKRSLENKAQHEKQSTEKTGKLAKVTVERARSVQKPALAKPQAAPAESDQSKTPAVAKVTSDNFKPSQSRASVTSKCKSSDSQPRRYRATRAISPLLKGQKTSQIMTSILSSFDPSIKNSKQGDTVKIVSSKRVPLKQYSRSRSQKRAKPSPKKEPKVKNAENVPPPQLADKQNELMFQEKRSSSVLAESREETENLPLQIESRAEADQFLTQIKQIEDLHQSLASENSVFEQTPIIGLEERIARQQQLSTFTVSEPKRRPEIPRLKL